MSSGSELRDAVALVFVDDLERPELAESDAHHLVEVLRVTPDESIAVSDGRGSYRMCTLSATTSDTTKRGGRKRDRIRASDVALGVVGPPCSVPPHTDPVRIGFAIPKGDRAEWIVQKLTELGVDVIVPMLTERTVVRLDPNELARRGARFRRIGREAAAQSRRVRLPEILDPTTFDALAPEIVAGAVLADPDGGPLKAGTATIFVGPEGGWSDAELTCGFERVRIADHVLRAETAAVAAAVLLGAARGSVVTLPPSAP